MPSDPNQPPDLSDPLADLGGGAPPPPAEPGTPPDPGEETNRQTMLFQGTAGGLALGGGPQFGGQTLWSGPALCGGSAFGSAMGGGIENPCGFAGWGVRGAYGAAGAFWAWTYRFCLQHPTIRLARQIVIGPILASGWYYEKSSDDVPDEAVELVERVMDHIRPSFMPEAVRCIDYGFAAFEPVWAIGEEFYEIERLKPLLVDRTLIRTDPKGNFAGFLNDGKSLWANQNKALCITHDGEAGNYYGRSRLENIRQSAWIDWLDCAQQIQALGQKLAGRQAYAIVPPGGYNTVIGGVTTFRTFAQDAADSLTGFSQGKCPILTSIAMNALAPEVMAKLAGASLTQFATIDFGNEAPAIAGLLERQARNEERMFAGYLRPSRTGLEGEHGARAETETKTDTGLVDSQLLGDSIAAQSQPMADALLAINMGLRSGAVRVRQSPLADDRKTRFTQLIQSMGFSPQFQQALEMSVDFDKVLAAVDIPTRMKLDDALTQVLAAAVQQAQAEASAGSQSNRNGSGKSGANENERLNGSAA